MALTENLVEQIYQVHLKMLYLSMQVVTLLLQQEIML